MGTVTEIYDYLRLLFARVGRPTCPIHNIEISSQTIEQMVDRIMEYPERTKLQVMAPLVSIEGLSPAISIFIESETATPYVNIIAVRTEDKDNKTLKRIAELYQEDDVADFITKEYDGSMIPTFIPLSDIGW